MPVRPDDAAGLQRNVESLSSIGGAYDLVAWTVEQQHAEVLAKYRLDTGSPTLVDLLSRRQQERDRPGSTYEGTKMPKISNATATPPEEVQAEFELESPQEVAESGEVKDNTAAPATTEKKLRPAAAPARARQAQNVESMFTPLVETREFARILYWGREGSTKTTSAAKLANLGRVLFVNAEGGIKVKALRAQGVKVENIMIYPTPGDEITYDGLEAAYQQVRSDLHADPNSWAGVVLDSGTEVVQALVDSVSDDRIENSRNKGGVISTFQAFNTDRSDYGVMSKMFRDLLRKFRDLQCHFIVTALERRDVDEDSLKTTYGPAVTPGVQNDLLGYVDEVLYCKAPDSERPYARASTKKGGKYRAKDRSGLLPEVLVNPTADRVIAYMEGELTEGVDSEQRVLEEPEQAEAEKPKPARKPAAKRSTRTRKTAADVPPMPTGDETIDNDGDTNDTDDTSNTNK